VPQPTTLPRARVLNRIFAVKMEELTGGRSELHNEEFHNLDSSPHIIKMIKSPIMRGAVGMQIALRK
jgi:hypothetical protein